MFRRRDEEENAIDAANAAGEPIESNVTSFGNFMQNDVPAEKKEQTTTSRSLFGINSSRTDAEAKKEEVKVEAKIEEPKAAPSSVFTKPAEKAEFTPKTTASTYKLSSTGAVTAVPAGSNASSQSPSSKFAGASSNSKTNIEEVSNMDKIETEKRLTVGYGIELEGKISNCDKLIVYGHVQADLTDVKTLHISESGKFSGFAAIENAEISGAFEGDLIVEDSIVINSTGRMSGKVTYGSIEIKPGGKFTGQIVDAADAASLGAATKKKTAKKDNSEVSKNQEEFTLSPEPVAEKEEAIA